MPFSPLDNEVSLPALHGSSGKVGIFYEKSETPLSRPGQGDSLHGMKLEQRRIQVLLLYRKLRSLDYLRERTREDLTICFALRQRKEVADVFQCNDDDDNGHSEIFFLSKEARRSLRSELNTFRERAIRAR
jgi:hypothetical protein